MEDDPGGNREWAISVSGHAGGAGLPDGNVGLGGEGQPIDPDHVMTKPPK
jgi:hypothetical protein